MSNGKHPRTPTLGLSMIVNDGADDLRPCLDSISGLVAQIVIADTGSRDNSIAIAKEYGAEVIHFPWTGHFAEARNTALASASTDWILVLDADEELSSQARSVISALLHQSSEDVGGYLLPIRNYLTAPDVQFRDSVSESNLDSHPRAQAARSWAEHRLCRLFRRDPRIRYAGRVHEVVEHAILRAHLRLEPANCRILHFGQLAGAEVHSRKAEFYRDLGRRKINEEPQNAIAWFELGGIELSEFNNQLVALVCLQNALRLLPSLAEAWILLFHLHDARGEFDYALAAYQRLAALHAPLSFQILQRAGDYLHDRGRLSEASACYQNALDQTETHSSISALSKLVVESKLGYTGFRLGQAGALEKLVRTAREAPTIQENQTRLQKALLVLADPSSPLKPAQSPLSAELVTP